MSEGPRIALLTPYGGPRTAGGVDVFNGYLKKALGNLEVFTDLRPESRGPLGDFRRVGLEEPRRALRAARALLRRHRDEPFELIISDGVCGWPLSVVNPGAPLVQVYHFTMAGLAKVALPLRGDRVSTGRVTAMFDRLAGMGKHVVAVSGRVLREVESFYGLTGRLIPNGVDTSTFRPMDRLDAREALGLPLKAKIGIFVGRPDHVKGYDILLRVAHKMPDVLFLFAGGMGRAARNLRPLGHVAHEDMRQWYAASDFFFLPSRYEGFSLSLLEALSCDVPAVLSEAAYPFLEDPSRCGVVARGTGEREFVDAIRQVLGGRTVFSPREVVGTRYSFNAFREAWRGFVASILGAGGGDVPVADLTHLQPT